MTEEVKKTEDIKTEEVKKEAEAPKLTEVQQKAMEQGWRPKEQFEGSEELFIDAGEFLRRGELFGKIEQQRKEVAELRKTLRVMQDHHGKVRETEFQRALDILRKQKVEAIKDGEPERMVEIEAQIDDVKDKMAEVKAETAREAIREPAAVDPRFTAWVDKNRWYAQDVELKEFADSIGIAYTKSNPGIDPNAVLKYVEGRVKKAYSDRFSNPNRDKASAVEGTDKHTSGTSKKSGDTDYTLSPEEEKVFKTLQRQDSKFWTREKYVADLKSLGNR